MEQYCFSWVGKAAAKLLAETPRTTVLSEASKHHESPSRNILIKGDNLEGLKHLLETFAQKIGFIYIDPPYNTGKNNFVYQDTRELQQERSRAQMLSKTARSHSAWLNFIYPRLILAQRLLRDNGVIFISIDDNEEAQLRLLCNELFGEENFITRIVWHNNKKGRQQDPHIKGTNEAILAYAKDIQQLQLAMEKRACPVKNLREDDISQFEKGYPLHNGTADFHINNRPNLAYSIYYHPDTTDCITVDEKVRKGKEWTIGKASRLDLLEQGYLRITPKYNLKYDNQRVWRWGQDRFLRDYKTELIFVLEKDGRPYFYGKARLPEKNTKYMRFKNYIDIDSGRGKLELKSLGIPNYFEKPKPLELLQHLLKMYPTDDEVIVLDFFAGSGSTAHAVMRQNAIDHGKRSWILIQLDEQIPEGKPAYNHGFRSICDITQRRIELGITQLQQDFPDAKDLEFSVFVLKQAQ